MNAMLRLPSNSMPPRSASEAKQRSQPKKMGADLGAASSLYANSGSWGVVANEEARSKAEQDGGDYAWIALVFMFLWFALVVGNMWLLPFTAK